MGFLDKLKQMFAGGPPSSQGDPYGTWFHFRCGRCGAVVRMRADRRNDFNREDEGPGALLLRKEVMDNKCYQIMRAEIWLDEGGRVVSSEVSGGKLITQEEYEAAQSG
jgi:hypothetical protein